MERATKAIKNRILRNIKNFFEDEEEENYNWEIINFSSEKDTWKKL